MNISDFLLGSPDLLKGHTSGPISGFCRSTLGRIVRLCLFSPARGRGLGACATQWYGVTPAQGFAVLTKPCPRPSQRSYFWTHFRFLPIHAWQNCTLVPLFPRPRAGVRGLCHAVVWGHTCAGLCFFEQALSAAFSKVMLLDPFPVSADPPLAELCAKWGAVYCRTPFCASFPPPWGGGQGVGGCTCAGLRCFVQALSAAFSKVMLLDPFPVSADPPLAELYACASFPPPRGGG
jgi:hypothetical protein